jgi:hypothetical protein
MLDNILAGKTARGAPFLSPQGDMHLDFTNSDSIRMATIAALDISVRMFGELDDEADRAFTFFARKVILFARRGGTLAANPSFLTRVIHAADVALTKPELLITPIGIPTMVSMALQQKARRAREQLRTQTVDEEIADMAARACPPPPPSVWHDRDGHYHLVEFTHPFHLWEEGVRLDNCLCRLNPYDPESRVPGNADPALLHSLDYWTHLASASERLFSLRAGTARIALFHMHDATLVDLDVCFPNEPSLRTIIADITDYFEARFGLFRIGLGRPLATQQLAIESIRHERRARKKQNLSDPRPVSPFGHRRRRHIHSFREQP